MRRAALTVLFVGALALTGCTSSAPTPVAAPTVEPATPAATPDATAPAAETSTRGNLVKTVGQTFGATDPVTGDQVANFRVTAITVDPACTGEYASASDNGHFVKLDVEGETLPELGEDIYLTGWNVIAENGTTFNGLAESGASSMCLGFNEQLPIRIGPGERVAGSIVLDVPTASGVLVLPFGGGAWEWSYPQ
ncbi:hypothetical protein MN032_11205 [Agromyces atrinae]|uniref:hypothetical protein n=1 Tax=Agromyces atrinae TaxID=592376 RepID=UPI001F5AEB58|nr:hypothetical protein [Agromyces atrinae]MCI2958266.1 hypothetical protein [Agromyces atrinae]